MTSRPRTSKPARGRLAAILEADPRSIIAANLEIQAREQLADERGDWPDTRSVTFR